MDTRKLRRRILQLIGVMLTASLAVWALVLLTPEPQENPSMGWEGVYPVLIQRSRLSNPPEQLLLQSPDDMVISAHTSTVEFTLFNSLEEIPVAAIPDRLMTQDPRYDPYLRGVQRFFLAPSHPSWEVVYYQPVHNSPSQVRRHLIELQERYPDGVLFTSNRTLPDWVQPVVITLGLLIAGWGVSQAGRQRFWVGLAGVPLIATAPAGNPVVFCALAVSFLSWLRVFTRMIRRLRTVLHHPSMQLWDAGLRRQAVLGSLLLLLLPVGIGIYSGELMLAIVVVLGIAVQIGVSILAWNWVQLQEYRRDHRLFMPLSLLPRRPARSAMLESVPLMTVVAIGLFFALVLSDGANGRPGWQALKIPQPVVADHDQSYDSIALQLADLIQHTGELRSDSARLPHLGDYLSHRAYQTGMVFGRTYGFPQIDEAVMLPGAIQDGPRLRANEEVRFRFTREWISDTVLDTRPDGLEGLLLQQGLGMEYRIDTVESVYFDVSAIAFAMVAALLGLMIGLPLPRMDVLWKIPRAAVAKSGAAA
ncbi:hypothetical protein [Spirochaeta africana]|uniref:Uncharacterized protein n=1 Tax=Spirochaeta africana (strain ATCC 700263 / DSM 8902 / Z-7692) TaxID=889378 RepID=H9UHZ6_SPIAZ|nr:hypothetical protein [Spirochaeta africana]AFG37139.1 hypothetical protein Spiaf_1052 [Spirochaeta africana DSM 8902]